MPPVHQSASAGRNGFSMPGFPHRLRRASNVSATAFALEAAITGQGLLLASPQLVRAELQAGKLVIDCNTEMPCPLAYFVVCQPSALERLIVQAFREALLEDGSIGPKSGSHFWVRCYRGSREFRQVRSCGKNDRNKKIAANARTLKPPLP
jgi:hypothetical protein